MKRRWPLLVVLLLSGGVAGFWAYRNGKREKPFLLSGAIEARDVEVGSLVGGRVAKVRVDEGAPVSAGDPIVTFETTFLDAQIQEQEARVAAARAGLTKTQRGPRAEEVARARADAANAEAERARLKALLDKGVIGQQDYDTAATKARMTAETLLELERGSRPEDVAAAEAGLASETARLAYLKRQRDESVVKAPAAGRIESMDLRPGDIVGPNQPVARILEPSQLWVRVYVPEPQLARVRVGQKASLTVDTYPNRTFPGHVVEIRTQAEYTPRNVQTLEQRMDQVFGVKVAIDPTPELKPGMAATVRLDSGTP
jgi:multidrug resistance efflux pump